jgi:hypothetical protein
MEEARELNSFKRIRNNLLHGIETPDDEKLKVACERLIYLSEKVINKISNENERKTLIDELTLIKHNKL